jgi:hypothetical protein
MNPNGRNRSGIVEKHFGGKMEDELPGGRGDHLTPNDKNWMESMSV